MKHTINKKEVIEIIRIYYGCTKNQAEKWYASYTDERKRLLIEGYRKYIGSVKYEV